MSQPKTLLEAVRYFADLDVATDFVAKLRWPDGPVCPRCGSTEHGYIKTRRLWKCKNKECRKQYSVKVDTIFEDSALGFDKWLPAIWLAANSKNGISSHELARALGVTQKSAWFMLHRIRLAMQAGGFFDRFDGEVEVDETYVGGLAINTHPHKRAEKITGTGNVNKTAVLGMKERGGGRVRAEIVPDVKRKTIQPRVRATIESGSAVYTDRLLTYRGLDDEYAHQVIDHAKGYVEGRVHTNGLENFWALLKRGLHGTYVSVAPEHLSRYVDERVFTFNLRERSDAGRFEAVLGAAAGRRLTYTRLIGSSAQPA